VLILQNATTTAQKKLFKTFNLKVENFLNVCKHQRAFRVDLIPFQLPQSD
jgi:hypothetical protein